ncbi:winged helix-turn-helix transcriptional regulator [Roseibium sp.]|uniref:winged helix-turn-helix transcriptional regulator n=1 Tax=Roseibium sp. TaxID=1936156 RepID=UPI003D09C0E0
MAPKSNYGQFCPVAQAAEVVASKWTPLILREIMCGSTRFNDLRAGLSLISPTQLTKRLRELEFAGVIRHETTAGSGAKRYVLTEAGEELRPIIEALGLWGHKNLRRELSESELDPGYLMWDIRRSLDPASLPFGGRTLVRFDFSGVPAAKRRWWLLFDDGQVDLCIKPPGGEEDLVVSGHVRDFINVWLGHLPLKDCLANGRIRREGRSELVASFPDWLGKSRVAVLAGEGARTR